MQFGRTIARTLLPVAFAAFVAAGCGGNDGVLGIGGIPDDAVCTVDGDPVSEKEFDRMWSNAQQQYKDNGRDFPKKKTEEYDSLRNDLVAYLVQQQLIKGQADKFGIEVSKKEIEKGVKDLKEQVAQGDEKKFKEEMKRVDYTLEQVRRDVEFDALSKEVYQRVVSDIDITDKDAEEYFEENPDQFVTKESREIAHILVKTKPEADKIYAQVKGGDEKVFAKLAKKSLDPSSKDTGGVLPGGAVQRGQTVPEFDKTSFELETGEVSKPVKTSYGWHVISARGDVKPESKKKFKDVKSDIKKQLKGERESEHYQQWNQDVLKDAEDDVNCREGYTWTQTETETEKAPANTDPAPAPAPEEDSGDGKSDEKADEKSEDSGAGDEKAEPDAESGDADENPADEDAEAAPDAEAGDAEDAAANEDDAK